MISTHEVIRQRSARIALLGCGTVGSEVARQISDQRARLEAGIGRPIELSAVLVRDTSRDRGFEQRLLASEFEQVLRTGPSVVIEVLGDVEASHRWVRRCLESRIPVVTAGKSLLAQHGEDLELLAESTGTPFAIEASVCAGLPLIASLNQLQGDRVHSLRAVLNGSCNYVLSRLEDGLETDEAVAAAQQLGLLEPDPTADLSGRDSAEKLCVLSRLIGFRGVTLDQVQAEGIEGITAARIAELRRCGRTIRLVAEVDASSDPPICRVRPEELPLTDPLAGARGAQNVVLLQAELAGEILLRGEGAGPRPTASAILGDVVRILRGSHAIDGFPQGRAESWRSNVPESILPDSLRSEGTEPAGSGRGSSPHVAGTG